MARSMTPDAVPASRAKQEKAGAALRGSLPRSALAAFSVGPHRDPVAILAAQNVDRLAELVPLRRERMSESPFAFFRGAAAVMADDLARSESTGIDVQLCGDAHLSNFGLFASRDRLLVFDVNDFDETAPGPWEWDLKRLVTSVAVVAEQQGMKHASAQATATETARAYRHSMAQLAEMDAMDRYYLSIKAEKLLDRLRADGADARSLERADRVARKAQENTSSRALSTLTVRDGGGAPRIVDQPPLTVRLPHVDASVAADLVRGYLATVSPDVRVLLRQFSVADVVIKVVGVGSVGTRCLLVLLVDADGGPLFLQIKEASRSVIDPTGRRTDADEGARVVSGQRIMQASGDVFLGSFADPDGRFFSVRQFRDMKGGIDPLRLNRPQDLADYGRTCAMALARAHAQTGYAPMISGYLGRTDEVNVADHAFAAFALAAAKQNVADHAALLAASDEEWSGTRSV